MFPDDLQVDDPVAVKYVKDFVDGKIKYEYLKSRIAFTIKIKPEEGSDKVIDAVCRLPHEYPNISPEIFVRTPFSRTQSRHFSEDLYEFIQSQEKGEICIFSVIQWIQENKDLYKDEVQIVETPKDSIIKEDRTFTRLWIYSHHIYSKFKRRDIIDWAGEMKLTGFSLPGKPGIVCIEGYSLNVDEYWHRLRRLNWKKIGVKEKEDIEIADNNSIDELRKFENFEEKNFEARGGKGREYHMDLGLFCQFLEDHGCGTVFNTFFGVCGTAKSS